MGRSSREAIIDYGHHSESSPQCFGLWFMVVYIHLSWVLTFSLLMKQQEINKATRTALLSQVNALIQLLSRLYVEHIHY